MHDYFFEPSRFRASRRELLPNHYLIQAQHFRLLGRQLARKLRNPDLVANTIQHYEPESIFKHQRGHCEVEAKNLANPEGCPSHYGGNGYIFST